MKNFSFCATKKTTLLGRPVHDEPLRTNIPLRNALSSSAISIRTGRDDPKQPKPSLDGQTKLQRDIPSPKVAHMRVDMLLPMDMVQRPRSSYTIIQQEHFKRASSATTVRHQNVQYAVEKSDYKIFNEMQIKQANTIFQEFIAMLPKFAEIYMRNGSKLEKPIHAFVRQLTQFETQLVTSQVVNQTISWHVLPMLFQNVAPVQYENDLARFASSLENNEYFRSFVEKDRAYVAETFKMRNSQNRKFGMHSIRVNTIADIGYTSFAQLYLDTFVTYYIVIIRDWISANKEDITKYLQFSAKQASIAQTKQLQKVYSYRTRPNTGVKRPTQSGDVTFQEFNHSIKLVTPLDIIEQIVPSVRHITLSKEEAQPIEMSLVFGLKSIMKLIQQQEIVVQDYKTYIKIIAFELLFLRAVISSSANNRTLQLSAILQQNKEEIDSILEQLKI